MGSMGRGKEDSRRLGEGQAGIDVSPDLFEDGGWVLAGQCSQDLGSDCCRVWSHESH